MAEDCPPVVVAGRSTGDVHQPVDLITWSLYHPHIAATCFYIVLCLPLYLDHETSFFIFAHYVSDHCAIWDVFCWGKSHVVHLYDI